MSVAYQAVGWNRQKKIYDTTLAAVLLLGLVAYGAVVFTCNPDTTAETFIIRFFGLAAALLLHIILAIGPLARLDRRFLPLLYNRRHLGVTLFFLALVHGALATFQFHGFAGRNMFVGVLSSYASQYTAFLADPTALVNFPFESLGVLALVIFLFMAATSHDFWLRNLGPSWWKLLHSLVYVAYGLVLAHVILGALQSERSPAYPLLLGAGFAALTILHLLAFAKERRLDRLRHQAREEGFEPVAQIDELVEDTGRVVVAGVQRIALFLHEGKLFALSNVCRHQGGPLGEGRVVSGCLTCPWHGYQYQLEDGCSPPPFTEIVPTYPLRLIDRTVYLRPQPLPLQTKSPGVDCVDHTTSAAAAEFYIGWQKISPLTLARHTRQAVVALAIAVPLVMSLVAFAQNPVDEGTFEFGRERTFEGILHEQPLALLLLKSGNSDVGVLNLILVGAGKAGPSSIIHGHDGDTVRLTGTLIYRRNQAMLEFNQPESFSVLAKAPAAGSTEAPQSLGPMTLVGELVDTKCFFGVMRPAVGKIHKGCAIECLSGGVPPGLLVRDDAGNGVVVMLSGPAGKNLAINYEWAAELVKAHGQLFLDHGTLILRADAVDLARP